MSPTCVRWVLVAAAVMVSPTVLRAAEAIPLPLAGADAPKVVLWSADLSLPDGPLADSRLDQPIHFWRAGLSMLDVFTSIKAQTGVALQYWPPQVADRPARVNLYLSPSKPPPLRDVLAQLAWVLDCPVAITRTEPRGYYLVDTSPSPEAIQARLEERSAKEEAEERRSEERGKERIRARLKQCQAALRLSRKEAVKRFRHADDRLLLDLVVPSRRAGLQFLTSLPAQEVAYLLEQRARDREWTELTAEQRRYLLAAVRPPKGLPPYRIRLGAWPREVSFGGRVENEEEETLGEVWLPSLDEPLDVTEEVELRRALGGKVSAAEERRLKARSERAAEQQRQQQAETHRQRLLADPVLSPEARTRLLEARLAWSPDERYALWQLQEAAAARTGLHVVSDCYRQEPRQVYGFENLDPEFAAFMEGLDRQGEELARRYPQLEEDGGPEALPEGARQEMAGLRARAAGPHALPLLYWFVLTCHDYFSHTYHLPGEGPDERGKEWGGGGGFLHFRTVYRQFWRGAMLPEAALARLQALESPRLTSVDLSGPNRPSIGSRVELAEAVRLASFGTRLQWSVGPSLVYEDPATRLGAARAQVRREVGTMLSDPSGLLRLLGTLSPEQWSRLRTTGLRCEDDLSPAQRASPAIQFALAMAKSRRDPRPTVAKLTLVAWGATHGGEITNVDFNYDGGTMDIGLSLASRTAPPAMPLPRLVPMPGQGAGR